LDKWQADQKSRVGSTFVQTVETFRYYAGWCTKLEGETLNVNSNFFCYTLA